METATGPLKKERISIEGFVDCYVSTVLDFMRERESATQEDFRTSVTKSVSLKLGISESEVGNMENPFHWAFFCGNANSPLNLSYDTTPGNSRFVVKKRRAYAQGDGKDISLKIMREYGGSGGYLEARRDGTIGLVSQAAS